MATGTSGDERDDDLTTPTGDEAETGASTTESADDTSDEVTADADVDTDEDAEAEPVAVGAARTPKKAAAESKGDRTKSAPTKAAPLKTAPSKTPSKSEKGGIGKFLREVGAELKKVVTPTRKELWRYVAVVLGFLVVMMAIVFALDFVFGYISSWVFGTGMDLFPAPAPAPVPPPAP